MVEIKDHSNFKTCKIYLEDLSNDSLFSVMQFLGIDSIEEGNFDITPISVLTR
jgi:hypothetical protein